MLDTLRARFDTLCMAVLAIDQGTTGTTTVLVDGQGQIVAKAQQEFPQHYPQPGWVEHDPEEIWQSVVDTVQTVCCNATEPIRAVGITNQRETTVVWDRDTGKPVHNAIVWQCRRTAEMCEALREHEALFRERTGVPLDAYFSGTKIRWLLDHVQGVDVERLAFGTIDTWLIWKLTRGVVHATDPTNASRTLLYNIKDQAWDPELCERIGVPLSLLPDVRNSAADFGTITALPCLQDVPILGVVGDQQAALFGQTCFESGQAKNTYGTGCFLLMNTGQDRVQSSKGLITTVAVGGDGRPCYALEGSVFIAGAAIQWLRDELKILANASESEAAARSLESNEGVYLVPAFSGLGAPHWDMAARGTLVGMTRGTGRPHLIRAALEAMAYQSHDVVVTMEQETGCTLPELAVDGGAAANGFLMQFQSDIIQRPVVRPAAVESTSVGAALLAGLNGGVWKDADALKARRDIEATFIPAMNDTERAELLAGWQKALRQAKQT